MNTKQDHLATVSMFAIIVVIFALVLMKHCGTAPPPQLAADSTSVWKLQAKQAGNQVAILLKEATMRDKLAMKQRAQIDSLQQRSNVIAGKYSEVVKKLRETAPIDCTPYIDSVDIECGKVINIKDDIIAGQENLINSLDSTRQVLDSAVVMLQVQVGKQGQVIEEVEKQLKKSKRKAKRARIFTRIVTGAALILLVGLMVGN